MFFFDDPFYDPLDDFFVNSYLPRSRADVLEQRRNYNDAITYRLNQVLREEFGIDPYHNVDIRKRVHQLVTLQRHDRNDQSAFKQPVVDENRRYYGGDEPKQDYHQPPPPPQSCPHRVQYTSMYYTSSSNFDGKNFVEEHREKVTDADGSVHQTTRRRLGDRWYEVELNTDKDGKTTSKEQWHNVPEDQIEQFKADWAEKQQSKYALKHEPNQ